MKPLVIKPEIANTEEMSRPQAHSCHDMLTFIASDKMQMDMIYKVLDDELVYTHKGETIILVDTSVKRTIRIGSCIGYSKDVPAQSRSSLIIKDISGNASQNPIEIHGVANEGITDNACNQYYISTDFGDMEFLFHDGVWSPALPPRVSDVVGPILFQPHSNLRHDINLPNNRNALTWAMNLNGFKVIEGYNSHFHQE